ncbi:MAG TPA: sugar phosphate isomerase/epimerase, partial [Candidatus Paceibacterota bacterium]|nr:sugar phosphate isomerase/epimerase [Candidatus Paceibacterota bacterium]
PRGGATVPLGTGSVDFPKLFQLLGSLSYTGLVTLQAARGQDGEEIKTIKQQIEFVQQYAKYL